MLTQKCSSNQVLPIAETDESIKRRLEPISFATTCLSLVLRARHRGQCPDPPVFCRARHERFRESDALRRVFEGVVAKCIAAGLVGGRGISSMRA